MLPLEHSATLSTFIKLAFVIKVFIYFFIFLSGHFTQVLLYAQKPPKLPMLKYTAGLAFHFGLHLHPYFLLCVSREGSGESVSSEPSLLYNAISSKISCDSNAFSLERNAPQQISSGMLITELNVFNI